MSTSATIIMVLTSCCPFEDVNRGCAYDGARANRACVGHYARAVDHGSDRCASQRPGRRVSDSR